MDKKALLVGINQFKNISGLNGCVNDSLRLADISNSHYNFSAEGIRMLLDSRATKAAILEGLAWLVDCKPGDHILFGCSSHGTQAASRAGSGEVDGLDEIFCPYDFEWDPEYFISDKDFYEIFSKMPKGVRFQWICDTCLAGDTKIPLMDGSEKTIKDMADEKGTYWVYSSKENGEVVPGKAHSARITGKKKLLRLKLDNGEYFECTSDHRIMMRDGSFKEAGNIIPGDSLMPLYRKIGDEKRKYLKGYEQVLTTSKFGNRVWRPTHQLVRDYFDMKIEGSDKTICHHKNFNKRDNRPENLEMMTWFDHKKCHGEVGRKNIKKLWNNPEYLAWRASEDYKIEQSKRIKEVWDDPEHRTKHVAANLERFTTYGLPEKFVQYNFSEQNREKTISRNKPGGDLYEKKQKDLLDNNSQLYKELHSEHRKERLKLLVEYRRFLKDNQIKKEDFTFQTWKETYIPVNHKVVSIEDTGREEYVYDLTVDEHHNFALSCGIFVHNCHSGDMSRSIGPVFATKKPVMIPRYVQPPRDIQWEIDVARSKSIQTAREERTLEVGFVSGCKSNQTSADTFIDGKYCGAMTYFFTKNLLLMKDQPMDKVVEAARNELKQNGYSQEPQAEGSRAKVPFFGDYVEQPIPAKRKFWIC